MCSTVGFVDSRVAWVSGFIFACVSFLEDVFYFYFFITASRILCELRYFSENFVACSCCSNSGISSVGLEALNWCDVRRTVSLPPRAQLTSSPLRGRLLSLRGPRTRFCSISPSAVFGMQASRSSLWLWHSRRLSPQVSRLFWCVFFL